MAKSVEEPVEYWAKKSLDVCVGKYYLSSVSVLHK